MRLRQSSSLNTAGLLLAAGLLLTLAAPAYALEYRSTGRAALLYDAPSTAAGKIAIAGSGLPLEVVVDTDAWVKVRDHS
ncbi:MAG TPA: SH3 domain-containing protein, partial [Thiobacillus sp.]|nr:SH3 domain-containing protein [Thiobacillus sp.]